jgi:D-alanyl-D-alanine carboxypeptidase/D-alanyl-D-alanine-endopeptidase (penicillin-binding protein 4)
MRHGIMLAGMHKTSHYLHSAWADVLVAAFAMGLAAPLCAEQARQTSKFAPARAGITQNSASPAATPRREPRNPALDQQIARILAASDAQRGSWGIQVVELASGKLLYQRDADHLFIPASNMKMFTTAAALEKLGPDYVFHTTVESDAVPDAQGRVWDLYLVGRGDPNLGVRTFPYTYHGRQQPADKFLAELADQVKARGVREVVRKLVADDSYFVWEPFAPNWAADDLDWGYGAPVSALAFNDNLLTLHVKPGEKVGDEAVVRLEPVTDYYLLRNHVQTGAKGAEKNYFLERQPGSMALDLWGQIPVDGGDDGDTVAIANPPQLMAEQFRTALRVRGIAVQGPIEVRHSTRLDAVSLPNPAPLSAPRVVLAEHASPPLSEAIKVVNKESENLHAEMLLRTLGHVQNNHGSLAGGLEALNAFAKQQVGIFPGETYFSDGSGLSREDLVAPHAAVKLLLYMARSPHFQAYFDSLPVSGIDGTLAHRLLTDEVKGKIHAKTGSVEHVNTLSGYMDLPSGKRLVFSIMTNNHPLPSKSGQETLDAITVEIYRWFAKER